LLRGHDRGEQHGAQEGLISRPTGGKEGIVPRTMILAANCVSTLVLFCAGGLPLRAQVLEKPPPGYTNPTIVPAGPSALVATAVIPARLDLQWATVAGARFYRIMRSSSLQPAETQINEINSEPPDPTAVYFDKLPERSGSVRFSYKVYAVFVNPDGSRIQSTPSPTATATALTPIAPPKLKSRVTLSQLMGRLRVTLDWGAVANATGYYLFQITRPGAPPLPMTPTTVKQTSMVIDNVAPGQGGTVCVVTVYELFYKDETARSCELVLTPAR
jgi:hypothetical protein